MEEGGLGDGGMEGMTKGRRAERESDGALARVEIRSNSDYRYHV